MQLGIIKKVTPFSPPSASFSVALLRFVALFSREKGKEEEKEEEEEAIRKAIRLPLIDSYLDRNQPGQA